MTQRFSGEIDTTIGESGLRVGYNGRFPSRITQGDPFELTVWEPAAGGDKIIPYDADAVRVSLSVGSQSVSSGWIETPTNIDSAYSAWNLSLPTGNIPAGEQPVEVTIDARQNGGIRTATVTGSVEVAFEPDGSRLVVSGTSASSPSKGEIRASITIDNQITSGAGESLSTTATFSALGEQSESVTVAPGESVRVEFSESVPDGTYTVDLSAAGESVSKSVSVVAAESELIVDGFNAVGTANGTIEVELVVDNSPVSGGGEDIPITVDYSGYGEASETNNSEPFGPASRFVFEETDVPPGVYDVEVSVRGTDIRRTATVSTKTITDGLGSGSFNFEGTEYEVEVGDPVQSDDGVRLTWEINPTLAVWYELRDGSETVSTADSSVTGAFVTAVPTGEITAPSGGKYTFAATNEDGSVTLTEFPINVPAARSEPEPEPEPDDPDQEPTPGPDDPEPVEPSLDVACDLSDTEITPGGSVTIPADVTAGNGTTETSGTVVIEVAGEQATETVTLAPNSSTRVEATFEISDPGEYQPTVALQ